MRRDGYHGQARAVAVKQAVDQMKVAGPAAPGADGKLAGDVRIRTRGEGGDLLVPGVQPLNAAVSTQGVGEAVEAVTDDAVNPFARWLLPAPRPSGPLQFSPCQ